MACRAIMPAVLLALLGTLLLTALDDPSDFVNPRILSPNGEMCLVIRRYPILADFERLTTDEYWQRYDRDPSSEAPAPQPERAAMYRLWPGDYRERVGEFAFRPDEDHDHVLVTNDGHVVNYGSLRCGAKAELLTLRAPDGATVRALKVRDVLTPNDQEWLCRGQESDVRFELGDTLRMTMLLTDGAWDAPDARHRTVDIDLASGAAPPPDGDHTPAALLVTAEPDDGLPRLRVEKDVVPITSQALLDRAVDHPLPEYAEVAAKARIKGRVGVQVVVGRDGTVESASIVKPLPFGLDEAVRRAILQWRFTPDASRASGVIAFRFEMLRN